MTIDEQIDASITKARGHILTHTLAGLSKASVTRLFLSPIVGDAVARVNKMADSGDLLATQQACQAWNRACKAVALEEKKTYDVKTS